MPVIFSNRLLYRKQLILKLVRSTTDCSNSKNLAIGFAMCIQKYLPLPSLQGNGNLYFTEHYSGLITNVLSEVNEHTPFEWRIAADYAKRLWLIKYNLLFIKDYILPSHYVKELVSKGSSFFDATFRVSDQFSIEETKYLNENTLNIHQCLTGFSDYLEDYFNEIETVQAVLNA